MSVDLHTSRNAQERGWGSGWPNCSVHPVPLVVNGVSFPGGIAPEVHDLFEMFFLECEQRGYIQLHAGWCWGFGCRAIASTLDEPHPVPSNHSWALAADADAPQNGYGAASHTIPAAMGKLANEYGIRWGGDYTTTKDWMHFEFMGTKEDARAMTDKARRDGLGGGGQEDDVGYEEFARGIEHGLEGKEIGDHAPHDTVLGYRLARRASKTEPSADAPASREATGADQQPSGQHQGDGGNKGGGH